MSETTVEPDTGDSATWPAEPPAQILLVVSIASAFLFVSAGSYLPFIVVGVAMPWLTATYVALHRDDTQFFGPSVGGRSLVGLGGIVLYPAMAFRALFDTDFDSTVVGIAVPCLLLGGACLVAWLWADPVARTRPVMMAALALQAVAWGVGGGIFVNVRFDGSTPDVVKARIVEASRWKPRRAPLPTYRLTFERFGTVTVPEQVFGSLPEGSLACVQRHGGRLGITWLSVERCPRAAR